MSHSGARQWRYDCTCYPELAEERTHQKWERMHSEVSRNNHKYFISEERVDAGVTADDLLEMLDRADHVLVCNACNEIKEVKT